MILPAQAIRSLCLHHSPMIHPFSERTAGVGGVTYGLSPAGYDIRIAGPVDMSKYGAREFVLASSIERFDMPDDVIGIVHDKSTFARLGLAVQNTVIEPGWRGHLTLELSYHGNDRLVIDAGTGIAQVIFHRLEAPTDQPYAGRYQDQDAGPVAAKIG